MKGFTKLILLALAVTAMAGLVGTSATAKKPVRKPVSKPASTHVVQGTTQLKGEYAAFGTTYTLGKIDPLNININSAEYTIEPVRVGDQLYVPKADEKLLVLHMTYHNPQHAERFTRWDSLAFTVVDPRDQNHEGLADLGMEKDQSTAAMTLKPTQKINVFGLIVVPASGEMPKLIVKSGDNLVLRYDLKGKVKGLVAPFADPADKTGATALTSINFPMGTYAPLGCFKARVNSAEFTDKTTMGETEANEGNRFLIVQMDVTNVSPKPEFLRWDTITGKVIDVDGIELSDCVDMFSKSRESSLATDLKPGQEIMTRCIYRIPNDAQVKTLSLCLSEGKTFLFDLSSVK